MFTKLKIKNFQSISSADIDLGRITVISGPSNIGKSAICRAVGVLAHNDFNKSYIKEGENKCSIQLFEGDDSVSYKREPSLIYEFSKHPEPYSKIGRTVPDDIQEWLNLNPIQFDNDLIIDFNFQQQFDSPFVISNSGFEIAKIFGKLMNLELVLASVRNMSKDLLSNTREIDTQKYILSDLDKFLEENKNVVKQKELLDIIENKVKDYDSTKEQIEELGKEIYTQEVKQSSIDYYGSQLMAVDTLEIYDTEVLDELREIIIEGEKLRGRISYYKDMLAKIEEIEVEDISSTDSLKACIIEATKVKESVLHNKGIFSKVDSFEVTDFSSDIDGLISIITEGNSVNESFVKNKSAYEKSDKDLIKFKEEFTEFLKENNVCPITNKPMTAECTKALLEG